VTSLCNEVSESSRLLPDGLVKTFTNAVERDKL
jgi:hypothetical protein